MAASVTTTVSTGAEDDSILVLDTGTDSSVILTTGAGSDSIVVRSTGEGSEMRISTGLSERLIGEYLALYRAEGPENEEVRRILSEPDPATKDPAEIKRGDWLR